MWQTSTRLIYSSCFLLSATLDSCSMQKDNVSYIKTEHQLKLYNVSILVKWVNTTKKRFNYLTNLLSTLNGVQANLQKIIWEHHNIFINYSNYHKKTCRRWTLSDKLRTSSQALFSAFINISFSCFKTDTCKLQDIGWK